MNIQEQIEEKEKEIKHYEGVLERYQSGRWLDMGRRHLAELKDQLQELHRTKAAENDNGDLT